jgi:hypothetical protein
MSWPTKILPFRKTVREVPETIAGSDRDEFPRFHKEQARPPLSARGAVSGFAVPPMISK